MLSTNLPRYPVVLVATGGSAEDIYGVCGLFSLFRHTHAAYVGWETGACILFMIVIYIMST